MKWPTTHKRAQARGLGCDLAREAVSARADNERAPVRHRRLDAHLASCPACRDFRDRLGDLGGRTGLTPAPQVPPGLASALAPLLEPTRTRAWPKSKFLGRRAQWSWHYTAQWVGALVPAVVALAALFTGLGSHPDLKPTHPPSRCTSWLLAHHDEEPKLGAH